MGFDSCEPVHALVSYYARTVSIATTVAKVASLSVSILKLLIFAVNHRRVAACCCSSCGQNLKITTPPLFLNGCD